MKSQRQAVYEAVTHVLGEVSSVQWDDISRHHREAIFAHVVAQFERGEVELRGQRDSAWIRKYVPGLCNNWVRKDQRLNGGGKYEAKRPGSRPSDLRLQQMRALLSITKDEESRELIQQEIKKRLAELKPAPKEIRVDLLPESLRHLVG